MDLIILVILIVLVFFFFKKFSSFIYALAIIDIVEKYCPTSILGIVGTYSSGIFYEILYWLYLLGVGTFLYYLVKIFFNKKV